MSATTIDRTVAAGGDEPVRRGKGRRWTSYILPAYTWAVIVYLAFPVFVMIAFSFNAVPGRVNITWYGFTLQNWIDLFSQPGLTAALGVSLQIALASTIMSTFLGALMGLALGRYRFRGTGAVNYLVFLAIASPEIVLGTSLLTIFVNQYTFIPLGKTTLWIAHVMFSIAFVAVTVRARVQGLNQSLEEAAQDLGATPTTTFTKVTLPLIMPAVIAGALLAFALSIDDFIISDFVKGAEVTFPLYIYGATRTGIPPQVNVWGTILFMVGVVAAIVSALGPSVSAKRDARRLEQDQAISAEMLGRGAIQ
jgi:spermidine/putrescine transport system permease protein